jgi:hypothetical protein
MAKDEERRRRFSRDELEELSGEVLPQRAATSLINPHLANPLTTSLAAAQLSADDATAAADAADVDADEVAGPEET